MSEWISLEKILSGKHHIVVSGPVTDLLISLHPAVDFTTVAALFSETDD